LFRYGKSVTTKACYAFSYTTQIGLIQALGRMKRLPKISLFILMAAPLSGCVSSCENEVVSTIASPSGKTSAVVFGRNCGATTGFNTQVSIVDADGGIPGDSGNVLIVDQEVPLKISWASDNELSIAGSGKTRVFKQEASVNGVRIRYEN
jgi:hypothetical protein